MEKSHKTSAELFAAQALASQVRNELTQNILPYWMQKMSRPDGGFYGRINGNEEIDPEAPIGNIMIARMLWTFASAYRVLQNEEYLKIAVRAKDLIISNFYDTEFGGTYWCLNPDGTPLDSKKQKRYAEQEYGLQRIADGVSLAVEQLEQMRRRQSHSRTEYIALTVTQAYRADIMLSDGRIL